MGFVALITWFAAALMGLFMLAVWLIENDVTHRGVAASRLPVPVILTHLLLAVGGLLLWVAYLLFDRQVLAWIAFGMLLSIATLGITMFARWIPVYRAIPAAVPGRAQVPRAVPGAAGPAGPAGEKADGGTIAPLQEMPAEGNFPVVIVAAHGVFAVSTLVLVLLVAMGILTSR